MRHFYRIGLGISRKTGVARRDFSKQWSSMAIADSIGDRIRRARRAQGLTLAQVAENLGVTPSAVQQWERGSTQPSIERLSKFAALVTVPVAWLMEGQASLEAVPEPEFRRQMKNVALDRLGGAAEFAGFAAHRQNNTAPIGSPELDPVWRNLSITVPNDIWARALFPNSYEHQPTSTLEASQSVPSPGLSLRKAVAAEASYSYAFFDKNGTVVMSRLLGPAHDEDAISFTVSDDLNSPEFQVGDVLTFHPKGNVNFGSIILVEIKNRKAFIGEIRPTFPGYEQFGICVVAKSYWDRVQTPSWDNAHLFDYVYWLSPGDAIRGGLVEHVRPLTPKETANEAAKIQAFLQLAVPNSGVGGSKPLVKGSEIPAPEKPAASQYVRDAAGDRSGNAKHGKEK
jgi:transcriptional regulator with XRE-family HTH domain